MNRAYHRRIATALPSGTRERLLTLLLVPEGATRSGWNQAKADPPRPSPQRMREHLAHLAWLRGQVVPAEAFAGVPDRKLRQFAAEARSLGAADLGRVVESKRLALMGALLRGQGAQALDDAAEMFVRLMTGSTTGPGRRWTTTAPSTRPRPTPSSCCCARPCWPARTRRRSGTPGSRRSRACCCPTPTRSW